MTQVLDNVYKVYMTKDEWKAALAASPNVRQRLAEFQPDLLAEIDAETPAKEEKEKAKK